MRRLAELYPGSVHVRQLNLQAADDEAVWRHAAEGGFAIVTKDDDFRQRGFVRGAPPKVIWVRLGNCTTDAVEAVLARGTPTSSRSALTRPQRSSS